MTVAGKLYLIGGDGPAEPVAIFDPETNIWTKKVIAPVVMYHLQAVGYGNKIYILDAFYDGSFPSQSPMHKAYSYNTKLALWQKLGEFPAERRRAGAGETVHNGKLI